MLSVPVSVGELIDKITILRIKVDKLPSYLAEKAKGELVFLQQALNSSGYSSIVSEEITNDLERVNLELWVVEDRLRALEEERDFGEEFVDLARSVYRLNDRRFLLKKEINLRSQSGIIEVKSHKFDH